MIAAVNPIRLLGYPSANEPDAPRLPRKARILLARLILTPHPLRREAVLPMLWPSATQPRALGSLRVTLHALRRTLGPDSLRADRHRLAIGEAPPSDLGAFLEATRQGDDLRAVHEYAGPLLADVVLYDTLDGDLWLAAERRRLARLFEAAARRVLAEASPLQLPEMTRLAVAQRLRDSDPDQLLHWQPLLAVLARLGAPEHLAREQAALEARLEAGEIDDAAAARALLLPARRAGAAGIRPSDHTPPVDQSFTNRRAVLDLMASARARANDGRVERVLLTGRSGIGKSALLGAVAHYPRPSAEAAIAIRAVRALRDLPFAFLKEVVAHLGRRNGAFGVRDDTARRLAGLDPSLAERFGIRRGLAPIDPATGGLTALTRAVSDLLREVSAEAPCTLLLDDVHWSDRWSRRVLRRAIDAAGAVPLLVVASSRLLPGTAWQPWTHLQLLPLTVDDACELVDTLSRGVPMPVRDAVVRGSGGIPLHLRHGVRLAEEAGAAATSDHGVPAVLTDDATWTDGPLAVRLRRHLRARPALAPVLARLALWEAPLEEAVLDPRGVATGADGTVRERLTPLRDLVEPAANGAWYLSHDRVGDAIREQVPAPLMQEAAEHLVALHAGERDGWRPAALARQLAMRHGVTTAMP
jgi:DNA-binding SARP family transcriptional activator